MPRFTPCKSFTCGFFFSFFLFFFFFFRKMSRKFLSPNFCSLVTRIVRDVNGN
ncbi:hypothetical protein HanPSC8_Chr17g0793931 [Helianthus annuus]|nr:hypothetical protein HanPSC8_Chr17g0793931 [Helianthus annuus]